MDTQSAASLLGLVWMLPLFRLLAQASKSDFRLSSGREPQYIAAAWIVLPIREPSHRTRRLTLGGKLTDPGVSRVWNQASSCSGIGTEFVGGTHCDPGLERLPNAGAVWRQVRRVLCNVS